MARRRSSSNQSDTVVVKSYHSDGKGTKTATFSRDDSDSVEKHLKYLAALGVDRVEVTVDDETVVLVPVEEQVEETVTRTVTTLRREDEQSNDEDNEEAEVDA